MDEIQSAAANLVSEAVDFRLDADARLAEVMCAAKRAGVSGNEIVRRVAPVWSRMTARDVLAKAEWQDGVRRTLTAAGVAVGPDETDDVQLEAAFRADQAMISHPQEPPFPLARKKASETIEEFTERGKAQLEKQWAGLARSRAEKVVLVLHTAGYRLTSPADPSEALTVADAIEVFTTSRSLFVDTPQQLPTAAPSPDSVAVS